MNFCFRHAAIFAALVTFFNAENSFAHGMQKVPIEGFVDTGEVKLEYLDYGGTGPALILIHGLADNPHVYDDLAPAFTDLFHVVAYARRGTGNSDVRGPYDVETITGDLLRFMDALGIRKASLVGMSAGGGEVTEMAVAHPDRVSKIVYLDAAYTNDSASSVQKGGLASLPSGYFDLPPDATKSMEAFLAYEKRVNYSSVREFWKLEADLRNKVIIGPDGHVRFRFSKGLIDTFYRTFTTDTVRDYSKISAPTLALYSEHLSDVGGADLSLRRRWLDWEATFYKPNQVQSIDRIQQSIRGAKTAVIPGSHGSFFVTSRSKVVALMRSFLDTTDH